MNKWENNELEKIGTVDELKLSALKQDGTFFKPVIIWVVRADENLFVRSVKGSEGSWYKHVQANQKGYISAGGITKDVTFTSVGEDQQLNEKIDQEYRSKYHRYAKMIVDSIVRPQARITTIKLEPI